MNYPWKVAILVLSLWSHILGSAFSFSSRLGACVWDEVFNREGIRSHGGKSFYFIWIDCLITFTIKMKVVLITYVIKYTIYFTFESIVFWSYHHRYSNGNITTKRKIRKSQESKDRSPRGFVECTNGGNYTSVSRRFLYH